MKCIKLFPTHRIAIQAKIFLILEKELINLRGHQCTLEHKRFYTANRVNYFANRVVNNWNSLPENVVGAGTLNMFKNLLDRLWSKQDLLYNYRVVIEKRTMYIS